MHLQTSRCHCLHILCWSIRLHVTKCKFLECIFMKIDILVFYRDGPSAQTISVTISKLYPWQYPNYIRENIRTISVKIPKLYLWQYPNYIRENTKTISVTISKLYPWQYPNDIREKTQTLSVTISKLYPWQYPIFRKTYYMFRHSHKTTISHEYQIYRTDPPQWRH
jgi:hypothetical protein